MRRHCLPYSLAAAAAAKLQSCPTLCDPIDSSPPAGRRKLASAWTIAPPIRDCSSPANGKPPYFGPQPPPMDCFVRTIPPNFPFFPISMFPFLVLWICQWLAVVPEKAMAPRFSTLAWKIPWTEEPGRLQSTGSLSRAQLSDFTFTFMHWRRKWQPTPVFLPGESQRRGSLVGCRLWSCAESDMTKET